MASKLHSTVPRAEDHQSSPQKESLPLPKANAEAIEFLKSFQTMDLQQLLFSETLDMVSDTGEPLGELTIDVKKGKYKEELGVILRCLIVHASSRGFLDKQLCGNSLLGYLSEKMEIMEQHSQEFIKEVKSEVSVFPLNSLAGFISEAANLVILRAMAWRRTVPSNARFLALDTEGKLCHCTYQFLGSQKFQMDHQQAEVFIVEQTVHSEEGIPMSCQYYLFSDGHLARRVQVGSPGCCIITKMPILREEDETEPPPVFEKKPLAWEEDVELYSRFLERKEELRVSHSSYLRHHPDAHALISDFMLFLLLRKPADVVAFAAEHFAPFDMLRPPSPSLRSSDRPSPFYQPPIAIKSPSSED